MKTVLFDLDGTLLPMDQDHFVKAYFGGLATKLVPYGYEPNQLIRAIWQGTNAMISNDGQATNEAVFWDAFSACFDTDVHNDIPLFEDFYENEFQLVATVCGHDARAGQILSFLRQQGIKVVLATNPIFPAIATQSRIRWAGLQADDFTLITTYENSRHCKPNLDYYRDILEKIQEIPENCIMVGNDVTEDMVARELGMEVFLLTNCMINKEHKDISQYPNGSFPELLSWLKDHIA